MEPRTASSEQQPCYRLRFGPLSRQSFALEFPCDASGRVDLDALTRAARVNYLYARAVVGLEFTRPAVQRAA
jgi:hypothetical protein